MHAVLGRYLASDNSWPSEREAGPYCVDPNLSMPKILTFITIATWPAWRVTWRNPHADQELGMRAKRKQNLFITFVARMPCVDKNAEEILNAKLPNKAAMIKRAAQRLALAAAGGRGLCLRAV